MAFISVPTQSPSEEQIDPVAALIAQLPQGAQAQQALALGLLFLALLLLFVVLMRSGARSGRRGRRPGGKVLPFDPRPAKPAGVNGQLALVAASGFHVVPLLNYSEARILPMLERIVADLPQGYKVMAQVSLGEVLRAAAGFESPANRAINAKRLDFIIVDRRGMMVAAIEYQGKGHHTSDTAFMRDAVKREALRKAGLWLIELPHDTDEDLLRARLAEQTELPVPRQRPQTRKVHDLRS